MRDKLQPNFHIVRLYDENNAPPAVTKVGILPFMGGTSLPDWRVMVMKPRAEAKHLGEPSFQLAKGTRRISINGDWCDMREDDLRYADASFWEPLADTALREGHEEIGLKASNIIKIFDMGGFTFTSVSKGTKRPLHMFAAQIIDADDFDPFEASTSGTRWVTMAEFRQIGRADHADIADAILRRVVTVFTV